MTRCHYPTDQFAGQLEPTASPDQLHVELKTAESAAPGWLRLWAWLLSRQTRTVATRAIMTVLAPDADELLSALFRDSPWELCIPVR
jgi:hypothetical protein